MARNARFSRQFFSLAARRLAAFFGRTLSGLALAASALGVAVALEACGADSDTGGQRVVLHTRLELADGADAVRVTAAGWTVKLTKALIATGPFYYFDGAPPLALQSKERGWQLAQGWLGLGTAHAHPGHYQAGNALGQMLESASVDLLGGTVTLPDGDGVTGTYRSARFSFLTPPAGAHAAELDGYAALAEGVAEKGGEEPRAFRATATLEEIAKSAEQGHVEGCEFQEISVVGDGTVTILVEPRIWFDLVDFSQLEPGTSAAPTELEEGTQPRVAFTQGLAQLSAYHFSYEAD